MGKRVDWGAIGQWVGVAIGLAAFLASLAGAGFLPDWYDYVWPVLALIGLVCVAAIILGLARGADTADEKTTPEPRPRFDPQVVPPPGDLPRGSYLPFVRNKCFTGRTEDLRALAERLIGQDPSAAGGQLRLALAGMGGLGKTTLAAEFAHRYGRYFPGGVFWLNAASAEALESDLVQCGLSMGLSPWPKEQRQQVAAVLRAWGEPVGRLVVLDNAAEVKLLREWLGRLQGSQLRLLITTRRPEWPPELGIPAYGLEVFSPQESRALLRRLAPRLEAEPENGLDAIAGRLGRLPLALDLAGRYLQDRKDLSAAGYLAELEQAENALEHTSLKDWVEEAEVPHPASVAAAFEMSCRRLEAGDERDELARRLFAAAGYLAPGVPIPREVFRALAADEAEADRALGRLMDLGLLSPAAEGPTIHLLLAEYSRLRSQESGLPQLAGVLLALSGQLGQTGFPRRFPWLWAHVQEVAEAVETLAPEDSARLWGNLGNHLAEVADYQRAAQLQGRGLEGLTKALGPEHPDVATAHNNLGVTLQHIGDYPAAKQHYEEALAIYEEAFGREHPDVAMCHNNLGAVLRDMRNCRAAKQHHREALAIYEKTLGPEHPDVAMCHNNLGVVLRHQADFVGAKEHHEQALAMYEKTLGSEHPEVAMSHGNLGNVLCDLGDYASAREHFEQALAIYEKTLPPYHPHLRHVRGNLRSLPGQEG